jgi:hypothetical protein
MDASLETFTLQTFTPLVGTSFRVRIAAGVVTLTLTQATSPSPSGNPFSLSFLGPHQPLLEQASHRFEHEDLGAFDLFVGPVAQDATTTTYQAVFNRLL